MTISNLVSGGQSFERPGVSAFFGKSVNGANDNVQRVSSDFLGNDILKSIIGAFDSVGKELVKLHDVSKNIIKSFETLMKNTRELNRDITNRFSSVNKELNQSKIDFLRSIMMTPIPPSDTPTTIGALVDKAEQKTEETKKVEEKKQEEKKSWLDSALDFVDLAGTAKSAWDLTKSGGSRLLGGMGGLYTGVAAGGLALSAAATQMTKGEMGKQIYDMTADNPLAGAMAGDYALGAAIMHGPQRSEENMAAEREQLKNAPWYTRLYGIGKEEYIKKQQEKQNSIEQFQSLPISVQKYWHTWPELIKAWTDGTIKDEDRAKVMKMFSDGESEKATSYAARIAGIEAARTEPKLATSKKNITGRNLAATIAGPEATRDIEGFRESVERANRGVEVASEEKLDESEAKNKRIAGLAIKYGFNPGSVTATLEGGVPTSITSDGKTVDVYNDLTPEEKEKVQTARKSRGDMRSDAKQSETPPSGANNAPPPSAPAGGGEGAGGPQQNQQQQTPPAPSGGAAEGTGGPEKAQSSGGSGGDTGGAATPPAGAPTPAPSGGGGGGTGEETGSTAPTAAPTQTAPSAAATAEGTSGSPSGAGAPEATPPAPTTPPAPESTPEPASGSGEPIIMNNSSSQSVGSSAPGETSRMSGQNLPMTAQNDKIKDYLAAQTMDYQ